MKAVLWTDVFQATLMYGGLIAMVIKGCIDVGGVDTVIERAKKGGRLVVPGYVSIFNFDYFSVSTCTISFNCSFFIIII